MTKDEALKLALKFVEDSECGTADLEAHIKEALAQPEQEPFAFLHPQKGFYFAKPTKISAPTIVDVEPLALYTTPPQRKPLTDEEIGAILEGVNAYGTRLYTFARAIEAAHGIKGEA